MAGNQHVHIQSTIVRRLCKRLLHRLICDCLLIGDFAARRLDAYVDLVSAAIVSNRSMAIIKVSKSAAAAKTHPREFALLHQLDPAGEGFDSSVRFSD
jgi:hypothetical protein